MFTYVMNYFRCTGVISKIQVQESISTAHFLIINSIQLKCAIIEHCCIWKDKLAKLLLQLTCNMLRDSYHYTSQSTEKYKILCYIMHGIINDKLMPDVLL
jgi:hypothetical protein